MILIDAGGEEGIRTLEKLLTSTPLAGERLRPLGHLSGGSEIEKSGQTINCAFSAHEQPRQTARQTSGVYRPKRRFKVSVSGLARMPSGGAG